ncbi:MAG: hypothetical protein V4714_16990 [Bacteroidota bacterium]
MKHLSHLSPAETLVVLHGDQAAIKEMLKFTFMDLLFKQVLKTIEVTKQPYEDDPVQTHTYVVVGSQFLGYQPLPHEHFFLLPFWKSGDLQILFKHLVKMGFQHAVNASHCQRTVIKSPYVAQYFSRSFLEKLFGWFSMTREGTEMRKDLSAEIAHLEKELPALIQAGSSKAADILKAIKGNIFLLATVDFALLRQIDKRLLQEIDQYQTSSDSNNDGGYGGFIIWDSYSHHSDSFDSSCGGHGHGGDSGSSCSGGDSGGSGGSGCSGCGGGGCGGGGN